MPQQVTDLLERRMIGEIVNVVSAIREDSPFAVQIIDRGGGRNGIFEPCFGIRGRGHGFIILLRPPLNGRTRTAAALQRQPAAPASGPAGRAGHSGGTAVPREWFRTIVRTRADRASASGKNRGTRHSPE